MDTFTPMFAPTDTELPSSLELLDYITTLQSILDKDDSDDMKWYITHIYDVGGWYQFEGQDYIVFYGMNAQGKADSYALLDIEDYEIVTLEDIDGGFWLWTLANHAPDTVFNIVTQTAKTDTLIESSRHGISDAIDKGYHLLSPMGNSLVFTALQVNRFAHWKQSGRVYYIEYAHLANQHQIRICILQKVLYSGVFIWQKTVVEEKALDVMGVSDEIDVFLKRWNMLNIPETIKQNIHV